MTATAASAQDPYAPAAAAPVSSADPRAQQVNTDLDAARRRESDVAARIAEQERTNASIRDQLRKVDTDPAGLQRDLVDVSDQAASLRKKVADQRQRRDAAEDKLNDARARAMDRYEQTQPMTAARRAFEDAAAELDKLSQPILEQLAQDPGYQEAQALVDAAAQAGEALQGFDNVDPKAQADADAAFDQAMARVREMEDAAIDADPRAADAHKSVRIAQDTLQGLRAENEKKIATDPAVDAARFALDLEQKLLDDSTADLSVAERRLSALRQTTQPNAGPPTELANQLKEGEA
jgi:chromosome segregation ATPase